MPSSKKQITNATKTNSITRLRTILETIGYKVKAENRGQTLLATKEDFPDLLFAPYLENTFRVADLWPLNNYAKRHQNEVLEVINKLNSGVDSIKYYLMGKDTMVSEAFILSIDNVRLFKKHLRIIIWEMNKIFENDKIFEKFMMQ